jgi:hypothetical protein
MDSLYGIFAQFAMITDPQFSKYFSKVTVCFTMLPVTPAFVISDNEFF